MRTKVDEALSDFISEIREKHPSVLVKMPESNSPHVDAFVMVECESHEQVDHVLKTLAHLTTKYYLDEGVYITGSAYHSGPLV